MTQRAGAPLAVGLCLRCVHPFQITPKEIQTDVKEQHENLLVNFYLDRIGKQVGGLSV